MPLELNDIINDARWTTAYIGNHSFEFAYRPTATSFRRQTELRRFVRRVDIEGANDFDEGKEMAQMLCDLVSDWDLEQGGKPIPINVESVQDLPSAIFDAVMTAIRHDREEDDNEKKVQSPTSGAGSGRAGNSAHARNGTTSSERRGTWA
jgi:hypothetical protein